MRQLLTKNTLTEIKEGTSVFVIWGFPGIFSGGESCKPIRKDDIRVSCFFLL
jgi:hypothetical protein